MNPLFRHCGKRNVNRPRGLCYGCYYTPGVLVQYPTLSKFGVRHEDTDYGYGKPLPALPTDAIPGSAEKLAVLIGRHERGEKLHHPRDSKQFKRLR